MTYLLKIREADPVNTLFITPTTTQSIEIKLSFSNAGVLSEDTLVIYPYNLFASGKLSITPTTLTQNDLTTYDITFTPTSTISIGK